MSCVKIVFPEYMAWLLPQIRERVPMTRNRIEVEKTHFDPIALLLQMVTLT